MLQGLCGERSRAAVWRKEASSLPFRALLPARTHARTRMHTHTYTHLYEHLVSPRDRRISRTEVNDDVKGLAIRGDKDLLARLVVGEVGLEVLYPCWGRRCGARALPRRRGVLLEQLPRGAIDILEEDVGLGDDEEFVDAVRVGNWG